MGWGGTLQVGGEWRQSPPLNFLSLGLGKSLRWKDGSFLVHECLW